MANPKESIELLDQLEALGFTKMKRFSYCTIRVLEVGETRSPGIARIV